MNYHEAADSYKVYHMHIVEQLFEDVYHSNWLQNIGVFRSCRKTIPFMRVVQYADVTYSFQQNWQFT